MSDYFDDDDENYKDSSDDEIEENIVEEENDDNENNVDGRDIDNEEYEDNDEDEDEDEDEDDEDNELNEDDNSIQFGGEGNDSELEEGEIDEELIAAEEKEKKVKKIPQKTATIYKKPTFDDDEDEDDDDDGDNYLQKFERNINENYIVNFHPECVLQNYDEILSMIKVKRDKNGIIIDDLHKSIPFLTKYERARILGQRAKQINCGATPFIKVPENIIDGYIIAEMELKQKRIPFIIRRPMPNGGSEYWSLKDLEDISF
jgi:DNA-directed RNA polymerase subunit K/omega